MTHPSTDASLHRAPDVGLDRLHHTCRLQGTLHRRLLATFALGLTLGMTGACTSDDAVESELDGRSFLLTSSHGFELLANAEVQLSFRNQEIGFSAGCNAHGGPFEVRDGRLVVDDLISTTRGCEAPFSAQEEQLASFMRSRPRVELDENRLTLTGNDVTLEFLDRRVADPDRALTGVVWTIDTFIDGDVAGNIPLSPPSTLEFKTESFIAFTGCNNLSGRYTLHDNRITLSDIVTTDAVCSGAAGRSESRVLEVLREGDVDYEIEARRLKLTRGSAGLRAIAP